MAKRVDDYLVKIVGRFDDDLAKIGADMLAESQKVFDLGDGDFAIEQLVDVIDDQTQYRLDLATDSAAWQAYQIGRVDAMDDAGMMFNWVLDNLAQHCNTCPQYAAGGPYTVDTLPGIPGDAPTECNGGCRCDLVPVAA